MNIDLPQDFVCSMRQLLGAGEYERFAEGMQREPMVSVRLNPLLGALPAEEPLGEPVPWCESGYYLNQRPLFTLDPLFHAGAYYVQEASSMFLEQVMRRYLTGEAVAMLDLCAAPGGKSTHARALLPEGSLLVSNEVMKARAQVLAENLTKWGHPDVVVTRSDPADFAALEGAFDVLLTDVPCSGEGMFRKDEGAVNDWSVENVELCRQRQQRILADVWPALKSGGLLLYSTCTYNILEDEANVEWICRELGAEVLPVESDPSWGITGNLLPGACFPVARFLPHRTKGEGLFMAALRKKGDAVGGEENSSVRKGRERRGKRGNSAQASNDKALARLLYRQQEEQLHGWLNDAGDDYLLLPQGERVLAFPQHWLPLLQELKNHLYLLQAGVALAEVKGRDLNPCHALAMSHLLRRGAFPEVEVEREQALSYLRREVLQLPLGTPRGFVLITYHGVPLGFVKHLGNRANNLYPQEWRIRNL
ncbi:MAG: rRNA cytosine-C5-methyltransferase [Bacteroides sp.]